MKSNSEIADQYENEGYVIINNHSLIKQVADLRKLFVESFQSKFTGNPITNRNLIKRFGDTPDAARFYCNPIIEDYAKVCGVAEPTFCGPVVTHYTANDLTGNSFGLPYHQDWPSMGGSTNSIIFWVNLSDSNKSSHGLAVAPGYHKNGLLPGDQTDLGFVTKEQKYQNEVLLDIKAGELLVMSPFIPHRTFVNPAASGWKLSLSRRFDDLSCEAWRKRDYQNAYTNSVNRNLYQN